MAILICAAVMTGSGVWAAHHALQSIYRACKLNRGYTMVG